MFVGAHSGGVVAVSPALAADASALVWFPNPRVALGDTTFPDDMGAINIARPESTCTFPPGVYNSVTVTGVKEVEPGIWGLESDLVVLDYTFGSVPAFQDTTPANPDFSFERCIRLDDVTTEPDPLERFSQAMTYFVVQNATEYFFEELLPDPKAHSTPTPIIVQYDAGGPAYSPGSRRLKTGAYGAEDAEVVLHEYGHLFHQDQTNGPITNSTPESKKLAEGGIANFVATNLAGHQSRGVPPLEYLAAEWFVPALEARGKYLFLNQEYPWDWHVGDYVAGNIFGNALWSVFDSIEARYGRCPDIDPTTFVASCAARDTFYLRLAHALTVTNGNQSFHTVAKAMLHADSLAGGNHLNVMVDAFDKHGWFMTEHDFTYGVSFNPIVVPGDTAFMAPRYLALELGSAEGVKPDSVFVHYGTGGIFGKTTQMVFDSSVGPNGAFTAILDPEPFAERYLEYYVSAVNQVNGVSAPGVTSHWPKSAPELDHAKFWVGTDMVRATYASNTPLPHTVGAGDTDTLVVNVPLPPSTLVEDVNVHVRVGENGGRVPLATWQLVSPNNTKQWLVRNLAINHVSWPEVFDVWFDDGRDAPYQHFRTYSFNGGATESVPLTVFNATEAGGDWKLVVVNSSPGDITIEAFEVQIATTLATAGIGGSASPSLQTRVGEPYPNPFNPITTIPLYLAADADVEFKIYDVAGRLKRVLVDERMRRGTYSVIWDGRSDRGLPAASGIYFYTVVVDERRFRGKALLLK